MDSKIALTGTPGVGKSTLLYRVIKMCRSRMAVGGILTCDKRVKGKRIGFEIIDLASGTRGILANLKGEGPRVGRYIVNLKDLDDIGAVALENALACDLVVVDEIGPMELLSYKFAQAVEKVITSQKPILAVVKEGYGHPIAQSIRRTFKIITVTKENRDSLPNEIVRDLSLCQP